jgi:undecaprenyl-diphosphatase
LSALEALLLGLAQGLTEFFPVSSSGHLVMLQALLGVEGEGGLLFEIAVHVATLIAIVIFYRKRIWALLTGVIARQHEALIYVAKLGVGTLPAVMVGLSAKDFIEEQFANPALVGVALIVTGTFVWTTRTTLPRASALEPSWLAALLIGCAQAFAILPGISRSGSTVATALALGLAAGPAAEFSFLLGIIAISGAAVLMLPDLAGASDAMLGSLVIGGGAALASGMAAIWLFVQMLQKQAFHLFAWYAWAVGALFLAWLWSGGGAA